MKAGVNVKGWAEGWVMDMTQAPQRRLNILKGMCGAKVGNVSRCTQSQPRTLVGGYHVPPVWEEVDWIHIKKEGV